MEPGSLGQEMPYTNRHCYKPSQIYSARIRVKGKLIRRRLKANSIKVSKLRPGKG